MYNLEKKFKDWQGKMSQKSEEEKHAFAVKVSFFVGSLALFFLVSYWYLVFTGNQIGNSFISSFQESFEEQINISK